MQPSLSPCNRSHTVCHEINRRDRLLIDIQAFMRFLCRFRHIFCCACFNFNQLARAALIRRSYRKRGLQSRINRFMFGITIFMFTMSTAYWVLSLINIVTMIQRVVHLKRLIPWATLYPLFNAVVMVNVSWLSTTSAQV